MSNQWSFFKQWPLRAPTSQMAIFVPFCVQLFFFGVLFYFIIMTWHQHALCITPHTCFSLCLHNTHLCHWCLEPQIDYQETTA